jgi:hypothetical protein
VPDDYYPLGSKAGDLGDEEDEDEEMEMVQEGWVVQGAQYLDNPRQGVQTTPSTLVPCQSRVRSEVRTSGLGLAYTVPHRSY